jgi:hypothetical protein
MSSTSSTTASPSASRKYYKADDDTSFGDDVLYRHAGNYAGRFRLQVSLRERPTLPVVSKAMKHQAYFSHLEFELFDVRALEAIEMLAEKGARGVSAGQGAGHLRPPPFRRDTVWTVSSRVGLPC